jgi:hypothetical protein
MLQLSQLPASLAATSRYLLLNGYVNSGRREVICGCQKAYVGSLQLGYTGRLVIQSGQTAQVSAGMDSQSHSV